MTNLLKTLTILIPAVAATAQIAETDLLVSVHVYNYAKLDAQTLDRAEEQARRIYRNAGIETEWVDCPLKPEEADLYPACSAPPGGTRFALRILSPEMEQTFPKSAFGRAWFPEDGGRGYMSAVCPKRAKKLARQIKGSYPLILGHLIAHELGHLLLGTGSHAPTGIMHVPWHPDELEAIKQGSMFFNTKQEKQMRAEVEERTAEQVASLR